MKQITLIISGVVLFVLIGGTAFTAARLWAAAQAEGGLLSGKGPRLQLMGKGEGAQAFSLDIEPAPELPDPPAEVAGIFVRREDDNLFVGTGQIEMMAQIDQATGKPNLQASHQGPVVEVVVNRETLLYQDVTQFGLSEEAEGGTHKIQQQVQTVDSLEDLTKDSQVQAWGERRGDRIVAEVLVFRNPLAWNLAD